MGEQHEGVGLRELVPDSTSDGSDGRDGHGDHGNHGVWVIDHEFRMAGAIDLGLRTSIVRLSGGGLWIHSPGPLDAAQQAAIRALGPVEALVAPNLFHHLYLLPAAQAFPAARIYVAPGLGDKVPGLPAHQELGEKPPAEWQGDFDQVRVGGMPLVNEVLFCHRASRTLFVTDIAFNLRRGSLATRWLMKLVGAWDRFGPSRLERLLTRDRAAARSALEQVLSWDFDRVVVTHGDIVESGGARDLRDGFAWLLD